MNPGKLNKRLSFDGFIVYAQKFVKTKRRDDEQNEESYEFIIRKRNDVTEYQTFLSEGIKYLILTVDEYMKEKGYLLLKCEKAKVHSFYDLCTVSRFSETENEYGETIMGNAPVYTSIPCELIRLESSSDSNSEQENQIRQRYEVHTENQYQILIGDSLEITHKEDTYKATILNFFKTHTHQILEIKVEGEA